MLKQKKDVIKNALLEAEELERASLEAAKNLVIENFAPNLTDFFKDVLKEAEHDIGKEEDLGREDTDAAFDTEEPIKERKKVRKEEDEKIDLDDDGDDDVDIDFDDEDDEDEELDEVDDVAGDPVPEKNQSAQPINLTVKQTADGWEATASAAKPEPITQEGKKRSAKKLRKEEFGDEDELKDDDEEFEVPDELFDDEEDLGEADDEDLDIDIDLDDEDEIDVDDLDSEDSEMGDEEDDEFKDLGEGRKISKTTLKLVRENKKLKRLIESLTTQMRETNLFNSKLAHLNKLYMSGMFTNREKERIAERLDRCKSLKTVKLLYGKIIKEAANSDPSTSFSSIIKEVKTTSKAKEAKKDKLYESEELKRMRQLSGLKG